MRTSLMASAHSRSQTHPNIPRRITHPDLPRRITHPDLPKGKEQVTMLCQRLQQINSANELQPPLVLPRRGDAGYSVTVIDWWMQVSLAL